MTITINDQFAVFWWVRDRAEELVRENAANKKENPSYSEFAKECETQGKALALMEIARDILSVDWLNVLADVAEKERMKNLQADRLAQMTKEMAVEPASQEEVEDILRHGGDK